MHLVELQDAWTAGAFEEARSSAHAIKGAAQMTGALRLAACCQRLEDAIRSGRLEEAEFLNVSVHKAFEAVEAAVTALTAG